MQANLEALAIVADLRQAARPATADEQVVLARWSAWGAVPGIFDEALPQWATERERLRALLSVEEYAAARRTTINAHYTDPALVGAVWDAVGRLGFTEGRVLEPGCGSGTFIGMAPPGAQMTGVELDPVTAAIAAALYPGASVRAESFAATRLPAGYFDATVGNVPFADVRLHDPAHNRGNHSIHNHFILKSLHMTRPGGLVAVLTSRYTLDATNPAARREMADLADLVGAVRLPSGTHRRAAGTEALTDLVILRRREPGGVAGEDSWVKVGVDVVDGTKVRINNYFLDHPERVLGEYRVGHGMYGEETLSVVADGLDQVPARLNDALHTITAAAARDGLTWTPRDEAAQAPEQVGRVAGAGEGLWDGHITATDDGFTVLDTGVHIPLDVPRTRAEELQALLDLRDRARAVLAMEAADGEDTADLDRERTALRAGYDAYAATWGPLNRVSTRPTGRMDPETGEERFARVRPPVMATFRRDPFSALVMALEVYDEVAGVAAPASILTQRVVVPRSPVLGVDDPGDALAVSLDTTGRADLDHIADLLGTDPADAREQLGRLVYDDPQVPGRIIPAAEYLSGNVLDKLDLARAAAADDPRFAVNVRDLEHVVPAPLGVDEIQARLGAAWIDGDTHQEFVRELLGDPRAGVEHPGGAIWDVRAESWSVAATSQWGTQRMPAAAILKAVMEQRTITVTDDAGDGRRVLNPTETEAAREKAGALQERFAEWVWEDTDRAARLAGTYNRMFNALVLRDYTADGARLTLPGLVKTFTPREHQRTAIARMIAEPSVGLFHEVGAGKTAEMVIGAMELRRLGMVTKPAVVVPNHMLEQFTREWLQLYPQARLLAASSDDVAGDRRRQFVARAATGDWDAVVMTRSAFERIPMSHRGQAAYMDNEMTSVRAMLARAQETKGTTVKRLEKKVAAIEERVRARLDSPQDPGITFEETGIDYLVIDEIHDYKNLMTVSNIPDAAIEGSKRASDLHMKIEHLRARHGDRVITGATATPIANSITEAHVMQRYMRPDLLRAAGVEDFDAWAATFGQVVTEIEMSVTGGFKQKTRFARFQNVPEMLRTWHTFADVKTAEDLNLPRPALAARPDGRRAPHTMVLPASDELAEYMTWLGERADAVAARTVDSDVDNMLKITTDGRKAALDLRLTGGGRTGENKVESVADRVAAIWRDTAERTYLDPTTGEPSPTPGALQLVFCDLGTPSANWNVYTELRRQLAARGMPPGQVRFIHEAKNDVDKARLFAAARSGHVSVLVGSTQKMGVGTNVQNRAVALHHLDCPWRPADLEQRDGRILRQGNQNPEISIYRWVVEGSFDAYSWQTVERKARFIAQVMRGKLDVRDIDDISDAALSFAEVKALASGDPLIIEREKAVQTVTRLERLERAWHRNAAILGRSHADATTTRDRALDLLPAVDDAVTRTVPTAGDEFAFTIGEATHTARPDAADALRTWAHDNAAAVQRRWAADEFLGTVGHLGGHTITATVAPQAAHLGAGPAFNLTIDGIERTAFRVPLADATADGLGLVRRCENAIDRLPALAATLRLDIERAQRTIDQAAAAAAQPFNHTEELDQARATLARIEEEIALKDPAPAAGHQGDADTGRRPSAAAEVRARLTKITAQTASATPDDDGRSRGVRGPNSQPEIGM